MRGFIEISQKNVPKRAFRAKLPTIFTEEGSKMIVSCEASSNFHRKSFQNERFVRGFLEISQNKLPKRAFRAMLPTIFTEKTSKRIVSRDVFDNFHRKYFRKDRKLKMEKNSPKSFGPAGIYQTGLISMYCKQIMMTLKKL